MKDGTAMTLSLFRDLGHSQSSISTTCLHWRRTRLVTRTASCTTLRPEPSNCGTGMPLQERLACSYRTHGKPAEIYPDFRVALRRQWQSLVQESKYSIRQLLFRDRRYCPAA